jgi:RNA polymerase sigma-70 factor (ECF subfamily)
MKSYSEEEIISGCKRNSRKFQELLYFKYFDKMYGMCLRHTKDKDIAMSVLNDGFLKVFKNIDKYRHTGSFEAWVRKVIYNTLRDYYRKKSNNRHFLEIFDNQGDQKNLNNLEYEDILKMIDTLPQKSKRVFVMYAIEGYRHNDISKILEIPVGTSKWHLSMAKEKLKEMIEKSEINLKIRKY